MKILLAIVTAALTFVGIASSHADTTNILHQGAITIKGKLSPSGTAVTGESLSGNTNAVDLLVLQIITDSGTNIVAGIGQVIGGNAVILLLQTDGVDLTPTTTTTDKSISVFKGTVGSANNAVLLVNISAKLSSAGVETDAVKFQGIWADGVSSVAGTIASVKTK